MSDTFKDKIDHKCICCEKIVNNHGECESNVNKFIFGYGSTLDNIQMTISICDDCATYKIKKGVCFDAIDVTTGESVK